MNDANDIAHRAYDAEQAGFIAEWVLKFALVAAAAAALVHAAAALNGSL